MASYNSTASAEGPEIQGSSTGGRLSPEEIKVLKECNRESFLFRCIPIGAVAMLTTHWAVKSGYLKAHPNWGSSLKVLGAGFVGYFVGKLSYQKKCAEKLMNLPNSALGEALRRRYKKDSSEFLSDDLYGAGNILSLPPIASGDYSVYSDIESVRPNDDADRNIQYAGLDDNLRPTIDSPSPRPAEPEAPSQHYTSYDELRNKNREQYDAKRQELTRQRDQNQGSSYSSSMLPPPKSRPNKTPIPARSTGTSKNEYGDVWDD